MWRLQALAETATWVKEDLDLGLRIGMVAVADIRAQGRDVRVARREPRRARQPAGHLPVG